MDIGKLRACYDWRVPKSYRSREKLSAVVRNNQISALLGQDCNFRRLRESMRQSYLMEVILSYDSIRLSFFSIPGERTADKVREVPVPNGVYSADYYRVQISSNLELASDSEISFVRESYPTLYMERNLRPHEIDFLNELEGNGVVVGKVLTETQDAEMAAVELLTAISEANEIAVPTLEG